MNDKLKDFNQEFIRGYNVGVSLADNVICARSFNSSSIGMMNEEIHKLIEVQKRETSNPDFIGGMETGANETINNVSRAYSLREKSRRFSR